LQGMAQLMAPILSFTSEEVWGYIPKTGSETSSVHLSTFPDLSAVTFTDALALKWEKIGGLKSEVSKALELRRQEKVIGHSLDAWVTLVLPETLHKILENEMDNLRFIFIVSKVEVVSRLEREDNVYSSAVIEGLEIKVQSAPGKKCERCWNYFEETKTASEPALICPRCLNNLESAKA